MLDVVINQLFIGASEDPPFRSALATLCDVMNANAVSLSIRAPALGDEGMVFSSGAEKDYEDLWRNRFFDALPPPIPDSDKRTVALDEILPRDRLHKTAYYQELLKPAGTEYVLFVLFEYEGDVCTLSISRSMDAGPFSTLDKASAESLVKHLEGAVAMFINYRNLENERNSIAAALDNLELGIVVLDQNQHVLYQNTEAREILDQQSFFSVDDGYLVATSEFQRPFSKLIESAYEASNANAVDAVFPMCMQTQDHHYSIQLLIKPIPHSRITRNASYPALSLHLSRSKTYRQPSSEVLRVFFNLTRAEARIVVLLTEELTLVDIAESLNISLNTLRVHIRSIYEKVGVSNRSALIKYVLRSTAMLST